MAEEIVPHLDPWTPRPSGNPNTIPPPDDTRDMGLSSEDYIASLEAKLKKLKGRNNREPSSKDIINGLAGVKEAQMKATIGESDMQQSNFDDGEQWCSSATSTEDSRLAALQRRLQPEQALNAEELKELLENDELAKLMQDLKDREELEKQMQVAVTSGGEASVSTNTSETDASVSGSGDTGTSG